MIEQGEEVREGDLAGGREEREGGQSSRVKRRCGREGDQAG